MANKDELRIRVQRFLTGPFNFVDLSRCFLYLRRHSFGRSSVRDLGNMLAHADIVERGLAVERVQSLQVIALYKMRALLGENDGALDLSDAPPTLLRVMDATFALLDESVLLRELEMTRDQVGTALTKLKCKFSVKENGRLFWDFWKITEKQLAIITWLTGFLISKPAYSAEELVEDTLHMFLNHKLMDTGQSDLFYAKRNYLLLFAIVSMHRVFFDCPDGVPAEAKAGWVTVDDDTYLNVCVEFLVKNNPEIKISLALFDTQLDPSYWSDNWDGGRHKVFESPIEITAEGRIRIMEI